MGLLTENQDFAPLDKYLPHAAASASSLSFPETLVHGAVATVADIGVTYWNSLTPEKYEASTSDLLSRIDQDALQVYNEHPDAIKFASFFGGLILPVGLSMKGMGMLRAGTKGMSWFSTAGQASQLAKVESAFAASNGAIDAAFIKAKWELYRGVAYNAVADNVAAEVAIMGTLSAHPYMEDYYKNFGTNFLKSIAYGVGIQGTLGSIIANKQIKGAMAGIEKEGNALIVKTLWEPWAEAKISDFSHLGEVAGIHMQNLDNLKSIIAKAEDATDAFTLKPYTIARVKDTIMREEARMVERLTEAAQGDLQVYLEKAPKEYKETLLHLIGSPEIAGTDRIFWPEVKGTTKMLAEGAASAKLTDSPSLFETIVKTFKKTGETKEVMQKTDAILTQFGGYVGKGDAPYYLTIADLGQTVEQLQKGIDKRWGVVPLSDWSIEAAVHPTARMDAEYAQAVLWVESLDAAKFNKVVVDPDHLPLLKALSVRAQQLMKEDPAAVLTVKLTKEAPSFGAIQKAAIARKGGVAEDYVEQLASLSKRWDDFSLYHPNKTTGKVSPEAENALDEWVHGEYRDLRLGAAVYKNIVHSDTLSEAVRPKALRAKTILEELYNSKTSIAVRDEFRQRADVDGNVWLYRGMRQDPKGHRTLESYTTLPEKAAEFGISNPDAVKMYKIHVDDIVATMHDFGNGYKPEILAFPPTRDWAQISKTNLRELPDELVIKMPEVVNVADQKTAIISGVSEIEKAILASTDTLISDLQRKGFGIETIALKTGMSVENVTAWISKEPAVREGAGLIRYASQADITEAIDIGKRAIGFSTNMTKVPHAEMLSKLNSMNLDATSKGIVEMSLLTSPSEFVQKIAQALLSDDVKILIQDIHTHLGEVTGASLKNSMLASTNQVLEALGPVGVSINTIGKEVIAINNALKEAFEEPIAALMGQIIKEGEATLIEANTALTVNASISGRRFYKAGSFWTLSEKLSLKDLRDLIKMPDDIFQQISGSVDEIGGALFTKAQYAGKDFDIASPAVREMMERLQGYGREMYEFNNAAMRAVGKADLGDIGFWTPSFNPRNKSIAYVHDLITDSTSMLYADSDELLASGIKSYEDTMFKKHGSGWNKNIRIVPKSQQDAYNMLAGRHDSLYMQAADLSKQHGGSSASTVVSTDTSMFRDILQGYQNHVSDGVEKIVEIQLNETLNHLKNLSDMSQGLYSPATKGVLQKLSSKPVDPGQTIRNILLGRPLLSEHKAWSELQQRGQVYTDLALKTITEIFQPLLAPVVGKVSGTKARTAEEWTKVLSDMENKGIVNPFDGLDKAFGLGKYLEEGKGGAEALTPRVVALGNGLAATTLLRVLELAQPLVNALSLPILTSGAVNRKMAGSFMGTAIDPMAKFSTAEAMYDGIRLMNHPTLGTKWSKIGEAKGIFNIELRNVTELLEHQRSLDSGVLTAVEKGMESSLVKMLSKPADMSESFVRRSSFFTGVGIAKKAYPGLSDTGIYTFARSFMDEAVGNYTAAQRPAMFQGTFGVAMGLFQTYMLTLAQTMYRQVEHRDWSSLGKLLLTQSTIFGTASLPGFHIVSEQIGKSFSDQHVDLQTGSIRAVGDEAASLILYGLPSSIGPGIVTRGDIQPRIPNPFQVDTLALVNITKQAYNGMERVAQAAYHADENAGKAMLEAISLQSISRPIARLSELASGQSITSRGDIVTDSSRMYTTQGIISRIMATRPLEEIKAREALHLNTVYGQFDSDKRKGVTARLKSHIRNGDMDGEKLDVLASEYLRSGSPTGWRSAVNDAVMQAAQGGNVTTLGKLKPGSPLNLMIEDID
jgi:hypothetical protein